MVCMQTYVRSVALPLIFLAVFLVFGAVVMRDLSTFILTKFFYADTRLIPFIHTLLGIKVVILYLAASVVAFFVPVQVFLQWFLRIAILLITVFGFGAVPFTEYLSLPMFGFSAVFGDGFGSALDLLVSKWPATTLVVLGMISGAHLMKLFLWGLLTQMSSHEEGKRFVIPFAFVMYSIMTLWSSLGGLVFTQVPDTMRQNVMLVGGIGALAVAFVITTFLASENERLVVEDEAAISNYLGFAVICGIAILFAHFVDMPLRIGLKKVLYAMGGSVHEAVAHWTRVNLYSKAFLSLVLLIGGTYVLRKWGSAFSGRIALAMCAIVAAVSFYVQSVEGLAIESAFQAVIPGLVLIPILYLTFTRVPKSIRFPLFAFAYLFVRGMGAAIIQGVVQFQGLNVSTLPFAVGTLVICVILYALLELVLYMSRRMVKA